MLPTTLTLADLDQLPPATVRLAVLGFPVKHSLSPVMHGAALTAMAQANPAFAAWRYLRVEVEPERLPEALERLHAAGFRGLNLTIPHKVQAVDLVRRIAPEAAAMGAVNTLRRLDQGWEGFNTDGHGLQQAVEAELGVRLAGRDILLLGAGGAARGVAVQCLRAGCRRLRIANRSAARLEELLALLRPLEPDAQRLVGQVGEADATGLEAPLVINVTSLGLKAEDPAPVDVTRLPAGAVVYDSTYGVDNALAHACRAAGLPFADGLPMLAWQGARALEIWSEAAVPAEIMLAAARAELQSRTQRP